MSEGLYSHTTRAAGTILTATIYNSDHENHITNHEPAQIGAYSDTVSQMRLESDPGLFGTENLADNLAGELERLRFAIRRLAHTDEWYEEPFAVKTEVITQSEYDALDPPEAETLYIIVG